MRVLKRMAVLAFAVLALSGCTKSSISDEPPAIMDEGPGAGDEEIFAADEEAHTITLDWTVKADTSDAQAMEYAAELVKLFNDIVAVQSLEIENSSATSFGTLWDTFALNVKISKEGGAALLDKSYKAGEAIDLKAAESSTEAGPEDVPEDVPKKV